MVANIFVVLLLWMMRGGTLSLLLKMLLAGSFLYFEFGGRILAFAGGSPNQGTRVLLQPFLVEGKRTRVQLTVWSACFVKRPFQFAASGPPFTPKLTKARCSNKL